MENVLFMKDIIERLFLRKNNGNKLFTRDIIENNLFAKK